MLHQHFDHRQAECSGLAGAGLSQTNDVATFHEEGNGFRLNRCWCRVTESGDRSHELFGEAEFVKTGQ